MRSSAVVALALASAWAGCSRVDNADSETSNAEPSALVLTPELRDAALQRGRAVVGETFSLLSSNLQTALASGGVTNALPYCSLTASPLTASMGDKHGVTIRRVTNKARNPKDKANEVEAAILDHYRSELSRSNTLAPIVTNLHSNSLTFFAPIVLTNALCLKCHGEPGRDIAADHLQVIRQLYPQDAAVGFQLGELRGAWRVDFPAKTLAGLVPSASR